MKVWELRQLCSNLPDDAEVVMWEDYELVPVIKAELGVLSEDTGIGFGLIKDFPLVFTPGTEDYSEHLGDKLAVRLDGGEHESLRTNW